MRRHNYVRAFLGAVILALVMELSAGCASNGYVSGGAYYGYGDPYWRYDRWYDRDVIVVPPPNAGRPKPKPEQPIYRPPPARPTPLPSRPLPRPAPMPRR